MVKSLLHLSTPDLRPEGRRPGVGGRGVEKGFGKLYIRSFPIHSSVIFKCELILEQYYLLDPSFDLNISRVANTAQYKSREAYMYNRDKTLLYCHASNMKEFLIRFGIVHRSIVNNLEEGSFYLGNYTFSTVPVLTAEEANLSDDEIRAMLDKDRKSFIYMYNKDKTVLLFSGLKEDFSILGLLMFN